MAKKSKDFLVSTADVAFYVNDQLAFTGTTSLNTSLSVSMEDQEIAGGKGNKTLYKYKYGRKLSPSIEMAEWKMAFVAANLGTSIETGAKDVFAVGECVTLVKGIGTLALKPVGKVSVEKSDGSIVEVNATANTITVGSADDTVMVTYQYNNNVKRLTIDADSTPLVGRLVLSADKHNNLKGKVGEVQIEIPSFQLSGTFDISLESTGNATTKLDGEIDSAESEIAVSDIAVIPADIKVKVRESVTLSVIGIRGGLYTNIGIDNADCTFTSDQVSTATCEAGIVKGVATGTTFVTIKYGEATDVVKVTVTA